MMNLWLKMESNAAPSSSSNHVVLQRLTSKTERKGDDGELPRIGEEDIDNVIGSCEKYYFEKEKIFKFLISSGLLDRG